MSQRYDLPQPGQDPIIAGNDLIFGVSLTAGGSPLSLAGLTLAVYLKASDFTPDALATVFTTSSGLVITSLTGGQFTWAIPRADGLISGPGSLWYRVDLTDSSSHVETAMFGALNLTAA
jgi:hypothetical protein